MPEVTAESIERRPAIRSNRTPARVSHERVEPRPPLACPAYGRIGKLADDLPSSRTRRMLAKRADLILDGLIAAADAAVDRDAARGGRTALPHRSAAASNR